jgi:predicted ATPase
MSTYVRNRLGNNNIVEQSNGESALMFWEREIKENSIYILDEPENSLSAENQIKLKKFIEESARFYNCQFIISTHSPFLLNLLEAKIYDLDEDEVTTKNWTELPNVRIYYDFFNEYKDEFKKND